MKGLAVDFETKSIRTDTFREDFDLVAQNTLVNLCQMSGSSSVFPDKGTTLLKDSLLGGVLSPNVANSVGGKAAVETIYFLRRHEFPDVETLDDISVLPDISESGSITFKVSMKSTLDQTVGIFLES